MQPIEPGRPILPESEFVEDFYDDFRSGLDVSGAHTGSRWSDDFYFHNYDLGWGDRAVINRERQKYVSTSDPHPDGWRPFRTGPDGLEMISRRVDLNNPTEVAYAVNKGYDWKDDRSAARLEDYPTGTPPQQWGPLLEPDPPLFWSYPQKFLGPMLTTRNRHGVNQHRMECRVWFSGGSTWHEQYTLRENVFAAVWRLQQVYYHHDFNGDPLSGTTQMPYTPSGKLLELDDIEFLGHDPYTGHHTVHFHGHDGDPDAYGMNFFFMEHPQPMTSGFHTVTVDVCEVLDVIGFAVDGIYTRVVPLPREFTEPMKRYKVDPEKPWQPVKDERGRAVEDGLQERQGKPVFRRQAIILNDASSGGWPRDQMEKDRQRIMIDQGRVYPPLPDGLNERVMRIDYIRTAYGKWSNAGDPVGDRPSRPSHVRDIDGETESGDQSGENPLVSEPGDVNEPAETNVWIDNDMLCAANRLAVKFNVHRAESHAYLTTVHAQGGLMQYALPGPGSYYVQPITADEIIGVKSVIVTI